MTKIILFIYLIGAVLTFITCVLYYRIDFASEIIDLIEDLLEMSLFTTNPVIALFNSILVSIIYPILILKGLLVLILSILYIILYIPASLLFNLED